MFAVWGRIVVVQRVMLIVLVSCTAACGGSSLPELPDGAPVSYREHLEPLVLKRCLDCHTTEEPKANLVLEKGVGYEQMVDRASTQIPTLKLVTPGDLEQSYLWLKLDQRAAVGEGMPRSFLGAKRLPPVEQDRFRRWIEDGALP